MLALRRQHWLLNKKKEKEVYIFYMIGVGCSSQGMADVWGHPYSLLLKKKEKRNASEEENMS